MRAAEAADIVTVPDMSHYIVAWRAWVVTTWCSPVPPRERLPGLRSLCTDVWWPYRQAVEATCRVGIPHTAPTYACNCGFWAAKDLGALAEISDWLCATVVGRVALWGRVVEHELAYRAQYAYPLELWIHERLPSRDHDELCGYCVPIRKLEAKRLLHLNGGNERVDPCFTNVPTMVKAIEEVTYDGDWRAQARDHR